MEIQLTPHSFDKLIDYFFICFFKRRVMLHCSVAKWTLGPRPLIYALEFDYNSSWVR